MILHLCSVSPPNLPFATTNHDESNPTPCDQGGRKCVSSLELGETLIVTSGVDGAIAQVARCDKSHNAHAKKETVTVLSYT